MAHNELKSIDLTNFVNVLMRFLVSCSNGGGQVSPVRTMVFRRILLSFSSCVQFSLGVMNGITDDTLRHNRSAGRNSKSI